jgi:Na+/H+ antiporter NhaD/arsenite permease-like protein
MEDEMGFFLRFMMGAVLVVMTTTTALLWYYHITKKIEAPQRDLSEDLKKALQISDVLFKVLLVITPFLILGFILALFVFEFFQCEIIMFLLAWVQVPVIYHIMRKSDSCPTKGGEMDGKSHEC